MTTREAKNAARVCPICGVRGQTRRTTLSVREAGICKETLVAAILTLGLTLLVPGMELRRRRKVVQTHCGACNATWEI